MTSLIHNLLFGDLSKMIAIERKTKGSVEALPHLCLNNLGSNPAFFFFFLLIGALKLPIPSKIIIDGSSIGDHGTFSASANVY